MHVDGGAHRLADPVSVLAAAGDLVSRRSVALVRGLGVKVHRAILGMLQDLAVIVGLRQQELAFRIPRIRAVDYASELLGPLAVLR